MSIKPLSDKEKAAFKQFSDLIADVKDPHHSDIDLIRWLQAKSWNAKKTADLYRKNEKWRKDMQIDELVRDYVEPEVMTRYYAGGVVGYDVDGCIIRVDPSGRNDVKGFLRSVKRDDLYKTNVVRIERTLEALRKHKEEHGGNSDQVIQIIDMSGYHSTMDMSIINFYMETMTLLDNHYPGLMKKSYVINVPSVFRMAWNFMKRFLSKEITDKFELFDSGWEQRLLADLPADQIPAAYGGTKTDPDGDGHCKSIVNYGGQVPKSYYRTVESLLPPDKSITKHVGRADILKIEVKVTRTPALLRWVFASEGNPLTFGVYRENSLGSQDLDKMEEIQPFRSVDSHVVPEDGSVACEHPGNYFIVFDNRSSRFTRRKVIYLVDLDDTATL